MMDANMRTVLLLAFLLPTFAFAQAHASMGSLTLPTWQEGLPDTNPPFDQFQIVNNLPYVYPYTMRTNFVQKKSDVAWRAIFLQNEYLNCVIFPDLGGHVYNCLDKLTGHSMFYNNGSIKKQWIGLRGSWVALGLESNFPNGHSWVTVSSVDYAYADHADGSSSVWVANVDRVTGMQWRSEFVLRPGAAVLEQHVTLENRSNFRQRYYWWSNAEVRVESNQDRFVMPTNIAEVHGSNFIDTWPVLQSGVDLSILGNNLNAVGYFAIGSHEQYLAFYQPDINTGLVHVADPVAVPGKKTWNWGTSWVSDLSDDGSTYIEIQGGATPSQTIYYYLQPLQVLNFTEYWLPIRSLGGVSQANSAAILNLARTASGITAQVQASSVIPGATIQLWQNGQILDQSARVKLAPEALTTLKGQTSDPSPVTFVLLDSIGNTVLTCTEGALNADPVDNYTLGQQPDPPWLAAEPVDEAGFLSLSDYNLQNANYDFAIQDFTTGLALLPGDQALNEGLGRLLASLSNPGAAAALSQGTGDAENQYYSALVNADTNGLSSLQSDPVFGLAASVRLAELLAAGGDSQDALAALQSSLTATNSTSIRAGTVELALLRALGMWDQAATRLAYWMSVDPTDNILRYESYRLGTEDDDFWLHLAAEPERVLNIAEHLMRLGQFEDALVVLQWGFPDADPLQVEPGIPSTSNHPLIWYYIGYCLAQTGQSSSTAYQNAAGLPSTYIFANRPMTADVLTDALNSNPQDAVALWLRGSVYLSMRRTDDAIADWTQVTKLAPATPSLFRSLGRVWLDIKGDKATALPILQQGLQYEPNNFDLLNAISRAQQ